MSLRFVHTADWQLGKPFGAFPDDRAALLREARLDVIERIGAVARQHGGIVLVAGDVFDAETAAPALVAKALARMQRHDKVRWHLISGNHDPIRVAGPWRLMAQFGLPDNVVLHLGPDVAEIAPGVSLLPAPLASRSTSLDPTSWMDGAETPAGHFRIGIAHGSVRGFSSEGEPTIPIAIDRARRAGLDYLALGDWHGAVGIDERTWYCGTPETDGFRANQSGNVLKVSIASPRAAPDLEIVGTSAYKWLGRNVDLGVGDALASLEDEVEAAGGDAARMVMRLAVSGRADTAGRRAVTARLERLGARVFHLETDLSLLRHASGAAGQATELPAGAVRTAAERIAAVATGDTPDAAIAARALARLAEFVEEDAARS